MTKLLKKALSLVGKSSSKQERLEKLFKDAYIKSQQI